MALSKNEAKRMVSDYFDGNYIDYKYFDDRDEKITWVPVDTIYLYVEVEDVIGRHIETKLYFNDEYVFCQSYYCQQITKNEVENIKAARILNYLNANLSYDCDAFCKHTFILDEEMGDIYNGCWIRYELFETDFQEVMNHILNYSVQQLAEVCGYIIFYITGRIGYIEATKLGIDERLRGVPIDKETLEKIEEKLEKKVIAYEKKQISGEHRDKKRKLWS